MKVDSDDELIQEVEDYAEADEVEGTARPQSVEGDLPSEPNHARTGLSTGARASTSDTRYTCRNWVS